jgi:hypothetical protein
MDKNHQCYNIYRQIVRFNKLNPDRPMEIPDNVRAGCNEYRRAKHAENPEVRRKRDKERYYENHEESLKKAAEERNTEKHKKYMEEFRQSEIGKKANKISSWKKSGVINDNFDELYNIWKTATNCADCDVELIEGNKGCNRKCLDHDHTTGLFRDVVCHSCNQMRGMTDKMLQM